MSTFDYFSRLTQRADLMEGMMKKLAVIDEVKAMPGHGGVLRRAANRCLTCEQTEACGQWLSDAENPDEAPGYCRNHDLFARVRSKLDAETSPAG
ncbi:DUF6455 family protein [Hoeflea ulvae]|uniref:DUF6455 family protein n=1 Tax=Hoeflea ulvae TaxID=2983764 RepID=A0ABT3YFU3_9HYPH|nr:DUF6455 family protein [Hoeflea ulvae]MCY0094677.1 DUF6455 family protein [Hoeflea ulvae]